VTHSERSCATSRGEDIIDGSHDGVHIGSVVIQVKVSKEARLTEGVRNNTGGIETTRGEYEDDAEVVE
jgi:hypothetical protein